MPRKKLTGTCSLCGQTRPLFDVKHLICGPCAGKKGGTTPKKPRKGGLYLCEVCHKAVAWMEPKCKSCGAAVDWQHIKRV
jgi:hypothetical protein